MIIPSKLHDENFRFIKLRQGQKIPMEPGWQVKNNYSYNNSIIIDWLGAGNNNYGVVCGNGLIVIDADTQRLYETVNQRLPNTFTVKTGKGYHFYYRCNVKNKIILELDGEHQGEVQTNGQQVVGPGCVHPSGKIYEVLNDIDIASISEEQLNFVLRRFERKGKEELDLNVTKKEHQDIELNIIDVVDTSELIQKGHELQGPHPVHGSDGGTNFAINEAENSYFCYRCQAGGGPLQWIAVREGLIDCSDSRPGIIKGELFKQVIAIAKEKDGLIFDGFDIPDTDSDKMEYLDGKENFTERILFGLTKIKNKEEERKMMKRMKETKSLNEEVLTESPMQLDYNKFTYDIAKVFVQNIPIKTITDNDDIYVYKADKGIWEDDNGLIEGLCRNVLKEDITIVRMREVFSHIKGVTRCERKEFNSDPTKIVLKNCVLDLETLETQPFSKDYLYTITSPVEYDITADCPLWKALMDEQLESKNDIRTLQEYFGFCLLSDMRFQKALLAYGPPRSGKSTMIYVLTQMIGEENTSAMSLHYLNSNNFAQAYLYGKKLNTFADLPTEALRSISNFMTITGEDYITCDKKNQHPISFYNLAKMVFSCNSIPRIPVKEPAFYRRWIILSYPNSRPLDGVDTQ